ncbi:TonB-dependent receptor plug domain-containing protein [Sporomusa acidovorans]|uniref:Colicin I receptor n=1 Tax=Sporomusa acidovorans (strain ATCC 49682 / DSM 3132 / Mol) TaxID=1123286 RepID=A0ABZ3IY82_SPOA4|nr:TonB-dependent receptor [Sporomusa acidovorans]OZC17641.1 colicin I receptor precursor [Sporomusa acidovorans DSM 3132]SDE10508.1 vitamin B12 transporter [Sporomusa acidovorans]
MIRYRTVKKSRRSLLYAMVASAVLCQFPAVVQAEDQEFSFDQVVVTANRMPVKASETAANVTVITGEEIEKGNYRNLGEILRHIPGVNIGTYGRPGSISAPFINGSEQVVVMIDGRRMNMPNGIGGFGTATTNLTSLVGIENIDRIEIVKGGRSALYGADAVGGVINIITKKGTDNKTTVTTSGGNWNSRNYAMTNQGKDGDFSWFFSADKKHVGNYTDGSGKTVNYTGVDQNAYTFRVDDKLGNGDLTVAYEYFKVDDDGSAVDGYNTTKQHNWDITYKEKTSTNTDYQLKVYQNASHRFNVSDDHDVRIKGFNYQVNTKLSDKHLLSSGIDWRKDEIQSSAYGSKDNTVKGIYLQDKWDISQKFSVTPGFRYDDNGVYGERSTPHMAANYKASDKTTYYASWGKVFHAPRFDDLYWPHKVEQYTYNSKTYTDIYDGNPDLKPETGWNMEFGINHKFDDTTEGKISYFKRQLTDAINWQDIGTDVYNSHWVPSNVDKQKADGIELQVSKQLTSTLKGFVGFTYMDVQNKTGSADYARDPNVPKKTWNIGASYVDEKLSVDIKGTAAFDRINPKYYNYIEKSYWVWDADINWKFSKEYTAFLTVNNIFDKYYNNYAANSTYPCGGRNYVVGVKAVF